MKLVLYPNKILKKKCKEVKEFDEKLDGIILEMLDIMHKNNGAGLAASQVGISKRIIVADFDHRPIVLINPKIIKKEGTEILEEGCLSFPSLFLKIKRAEKIRVIARTPKGDKNEFDVEGLLAQIIQHEIDHLDGVLFIDRLGFFERQKIKKKLRPQKK